MVDAVDAVGVIAVIAHVTAKDFGTQLEPTFGLPAQCGNGARIEIGVHVGIGVFVFELLAYEDGQLAGVLCDKTRKDHVGQVVVALGIGIEVIGDATATIIMASGLGRDVLAHVGAMVTKQTDGHGRDVPIVVGIVEPSLHGTGRVGGHLIQTVHLGDDALTGAVIFQLVGVFSPSIVVGRDDEVLGTVIIAAQPLLHTGGIVDDRQLVVIHQLGSEDGVPIG